MRAMIPMTIFALAGCAAATGSLEERERTGLAADLSTRVAGETQSCASQIGQTGSIRIVDRNTLVSEQGRTIWVNRLPESCPGLRTDSVLILETFNGNYCRNDRFRAVDRGSNIPGPWCRLGEWTPYRMAE